MRITELTVGLIGTCCYLLSPEGGSSCLVIDPGDEPSRIRDAAGDLHIAALLLTHGHFDHIGAVEKLMAPGTELLIHPLDRPMLSDPSLNASLSLLSRPVTAPEPTRLVREGDVFSLAGLSVRVLHTPGHTPGGVCYDIEGHLFTGDTMFHHGWGRTDLPGGDESALFYSLRRLMPLAQTCPIHPGHQT